MIKYFFCAMSLFFVVSSFGQNHVTTNPSKEEGITKVYEFLKTCGTYYLATMDGNQPRVRPFGTIALFEEKLYIQTGKSKNVSKQMKINSKVEICAFDAATNTWVRIEAKVVNDDRTEAKQFMLEQYPSLQKMYSATDNNTQVLYLENVIATFNTFGEEAKVYNF